jgi:hypothetical protein
VDLLREQVAILDTAGLALEQRARLSPYHSVFIDKAGFSKYAVGSFTP